MTIVRREHRAHFTIVPNAIFVDTRLSIEAKGVLGYLLSRPHKWRVQLDYVARTLNIGRRKLQRIFRELIGAGYVSREQQRFGAGHRFGTLDYVVRDVPLVLANPVENSPIPRVGNGPTVPRVRKGPAYKEAPRVRNGPAYKEIDKNGESEPLRDLEVEGKIGFPANRERRSTTEGDDARLDASIVELFVDKAEGWEFLAALPDDVLAQLRRRQHRGELDSIVLSDFWIRYGNLLRGPRRPEIKSN